MRKEIIGNWKMNGLLSSERVFRDLISGYDSSCASSNIARLTICPPSTLLVSFSSIASSERSQISLGGQYCHRSLRGSHTGEISAEMLRDSGARLTLVGHAERRASGEDDKEVALQLRAGLCAGLGVVLCVGECQSDRSAGRTRTVLREQLSRALDARHSCGIEFHEDSFLMVAYEPLWSIGSGDTPGSAEIAETCGALVEDARAALSSGVSGEVLSSLDISVLYGGSVTSANAASILPIVDGLLIGKASLQAAELLAIVALASVAEPAEV